MVTFGHVLILEFHVVRRTVGEKRPFLVRQRAGLLDRAADVEKAAFQALARWHQAAGTDDHLVLDDRAVHDDAAHADQDPVAHRAAMQHDLVGDGHVVADQQREPLGVEGPGVGDVQHAAVLHAGALADADAVHVAADHGQWPDGAVGADFDVADHHRRTVDKGPFTQCRRVVLIGTKGHDRRSL